MDYQFKGLPLTPSVCESLILEIFNGKTETRKTIVDTLMAEHKRRGGMDATASDIARVVKKALENLRKVEKAENPVQRYWKISNVSSTEPVPSFSQAAFESKLPLHPALFQYDKADIMSLRSEILPPKWEHWGRFETAEKVTLCEGQRFFINIQILFLFK
jgi:hypothetical protein